MAWIATTSFSEATGQLKEIYKRLLGSRTKADNILTLHSLRPHTMAGHLELYKSVLHNSSNQVPTWFLELLGVWVSNLNGCLYCAQHHFMGMKKILKDEAKSEALNSAIKSRNFDYSTFTTKEISALKYAQVLTESPAMVSESEVKNLRSAGFSDGEILEINQVVSYFAYANRTVLGLGCTLEEGEIGNSPRDV